MGLNYKSIHVIGICGTFMAGVASLAKSLGYTVTGCDRDIYPPMSTYLQSQGINLQIISDTNPASDIIPRVEL